ncbi:MAG: RHS repeat-associated core domain-containing protein, partial [Sulfurovum sp.]|nr:RHS repeat-associated core domain-containing protein [Sulfurovum sp.]
ILEHTQSEETHNPYCYTAREFDREDLYYYRARYYDPTLGRFISSDPIEFLAGDFNFYRYVGNDPVNWNDPSGLFTDELAALGGLIYAGAAAGAAILTPYVEKLINTISSKISKIEAEDASADKGLVVTAGGKQTTQSPYKDLENEFLDMGPHDPCKTMKDYIKKMEKQIEWRKGDLNSASSTYQGHLKRIKLLEDQSKKLAGYLALGFCSGSN